MKVLFRLVAVLVVGTASVILAQRVMRGIYKNIGRKYIVIENPQHYKLGA